MRAGIVPCAHGGAPRRWRRSWRGKTHMREDGAPPDGAGKVVLRRGGIVESEHRIHGVVTDGGGTILARFGDAERPVFLRSAAKPFQAIPLVADGAADRFRLSSGELAVTCGSHGGEEGHVETVARLLDRGGFAVSDLACGSHPPMHGPSARRLQEAGTAPGRVHNNCSGKHAGMLLLARHHGWPTEGYHEEGHPVQERMAREVAHWMDLPEEAMGRGVDGCGVVCFTAPLRALARGFAALMSAGEGERDDPPEAGGRGEAARRVVAAMREHPFQVAGSGRLCTALMEAGGRNLVAKVGAEGVYGAAFSGPRGPVGVAMKVEDGARRAVEAALVEVLRRLGALDGVGVEGMRALDPWLHPVVANTRGEPAAVLEVQLSVGEAAIAGAVGRKVAGKVTGCGG
ncbi:MAG: asparaginase [Gemmatimonadales bacterium]|nr:MAG: asparaginase [Gemmatimonadales bacterium]